MAGRIYMIAAADPNPLTEAHYTFADGYLIAGPSRAMLTRALQVKSTRTSITHSAQFLSMEPRDHYANFSALVYQNLGTSLAPLAGTARRIRPQRESGRPCKPAEQPHEHEAHAAGGLWRAGSRDRGGQQQPARFGPY